MQDLYTTAMIQLPLCAVRETALRLKTPADIVEYCKDMRDLTQESFHVIVLNSRNNLITRQMITLGLIDASLIHPREVFRTAIVHNAAAIVLVHNHPSGDPSPSAEDIRLTRQLIDAGKILGIKIMDHVIIGRPTTPDDKGFISLRETGMVSFDIPMNFGG